MASSLCLIATVGCNDTAEQKNAAVDNTEAVEEKTLDNSTEKAAALSLSNQALSNVTKNKPKRLSDVVKNQSVSLNGTKFTLVSETLEKGAQVLNLAMNEFGRVKGSVVVVLAEGNELSSASFAKTAKLAKNTYRVWPIENVEFLTFYNTLAKNKTYKTVEADIDYSAQSNAQTH